MKNSQPYFPTSIGNPTKDKSILLYTPPSIMVWLAGLQLFFTMCIVGLQIASLVGGLNHVNSLRSDVTDLNMKISRIEHVFDTATKKLPANQIELVSKQIVGILENTHQLSARFKFLVDKMEPASSMAMLNDVKTITERLGGVLRDEGDLMNMVRIGNRMFENVTGTEVSKVLSGLGKINMEMLNELVEITKRVEKRLESLHEIKIQI
jgi:uncharacterized protein YoxC